MEHTTGEVYFYDDGSASCLLSTRASHEEAFMHELCFWASFANHQFNTMGRDGTILAERLLGVASGLPDPDKTGCKESFSEWLIKMATTNNDAFVQQRSDEPRLKEPEAASPRKGFEAQLIPQGEGYQLCLYVKGFGWLGKGLKDYCPWSVMLLLRHLMMKYDGQPEKMAALMQLAVFTGQSYLQGQVNMQNRDYMASLAVGGILAEFRLIPGNTSPICNGLYRQRGKLASSQVGLQR